MRAPAAEKQGQYLQTENAQSPLWLEPDNKRTGTAYRKPRSTILQTRSLAQAAAKHLSEVPRKPNSLHHLSSSPSWEMPGGEDKWEVTPLPQSFTRNRKIGLRAQGYIGMIKPWISSSLPYSSVGSYPGGFCSEKFVS